MIFLLLACKGDVVDSAATEEVTWPRFYARPEHKDPTLARLDDEPWSHLHGRVVERAEADFEAWDTQVWDHSVHGHNGEIAMNAALLAWLHDDADRAAVARQWFDELPTDFDTNATWDVNIRMPASLMSGAAAWDLLTGAEAWEDSEAEAARDKLLAITRAFHDRYVEEETLRLVALHYSQNNHPIRTATAIGAVGVLFEDEELADWALSELTYLWGPDGQYVQADGGVSEGPHYYAFALAPTLAFAVGMQNWADSGGSWSFSWDCINRLDQGVWADHGCVDGDEGTWRDLLADDRFLASVDWSIDLRTPLGWRAPYEDAYLRPVNGGGLLAAWTGEGRHLWDVEHSGDDDWPLTSGLDLVGHHLLYTPAEVVAEEPAWTHAVYEDGGIAVLRTGWGEQDLWLKLVGEHGAVRQTLHDHVDSLSFTLAAYGDYLLVDPGYHKPNELDNAVTSDADAHNVVLIEGQGAPDKGLLLDFGDTDAYLAPLVEDEDVAYVEASQSYEQTDFVRGVALVRDRYFVVADTLSSSEDEPREHAWRLGGWAGHDVGHTWELLSDGVVVARDLGGVEVRVASSAALEVVEPPLVDGAAPHVEEMSRDRDIQHHGVIDATVTAVAPSFLAVLAPFPVDGSVERLTVTRADGVGWTVSGADFTDTVTLDESGLSIQGDGVDFSR